MNNTNNNKLPATNDHATLPTAKHPPPTLDELCTQLPTRNAQPTTYNKLKAKPNISPKKNTLKQNWSGGMREAV